MYILARLARQCISQRGLLAGAFADSCRHSIFPRSAGLLADAWSGVLFAAVVRVYLDRAACALDEDCSLRELLRGSEMLACPARKLPRSRRWFRS